MSEDGSNEDAHAEDDGARRPRPPVGDELEDDQEDIEGVQDQDDSDSDGDGDGGGEEANDEELMARWMAFLRARPRPPVPPRVAPLDASAFGGRVANSDAKAFAAAGVPLLRTLWERLILPLCSARSLCVLAQTCTYMRDVTCNDSLWETRFAQDRDGPVCLVQAGVCTWKDRYRCAQSVAEGIATAVSMAGAHETIVLLPGMHETAAMVPFPVPLIIEQPIHLLGCAYNRLFAVPIKLGHAADVERVAPRDIGNVVLYSGQVTPLEWAADGGSIKNMDVRFLSQVDSQFFFAFKMSRPTARVALENVCLQSTQHAAVCMNGGGELVGRHVRICGAKGTGMTVSKESRCTLIESLIDFNGASGIEVDGEGAQLVLERCVIHSNALNGVGAAKGSTLRMRQCSVFAHRLNGVEGDNLVGSIENCDIHDNLHGILSWTEVAPGETVDVDSMRAALARGNVLANRIDVNCKTRVAGASPVDTALQENLCTYMLTGPHFYAHPNIFTCVTCNISGREGICGSCARTCHAGHVTEDRGPVSGFYCDCFFHNECHFRGQIARAVEGKEGPGSGGQ